MKTFLKIMAGIGAVVVLIIAAVFFMTAGMTDTADKFFTAVKSGNYDEAYSYLSEDFKNSTSKIELKSYLTSNSLNDFKESSWGSRSVSGGRGELTGSITTENGGVVPVSIEFIKGEKDWKIYSIKKPHSGIQEETTMAQMPSEKEQIKLVSDSMEIFAVSIKERSMKQLFGHISNFWRKQYSVPEMDEAFGSLYQFGDSFMVLSQLSPQFTEKASIDNNGVLALKGLYPTNPDQVHFDLEYIYEGLGWKLTGFTVNIK